MSRTALIMTVVALLAASSGYFLARALTTREEAAANSATSSLAAAAQTTSGDDLLGKKRPDFTLRDLAGAPVSASDFDGQIWLANFWATWCKPCVDEMPMLSRLQRDFAGQGVQIVGIALDDEERARRFAQDLSIAYPVLVGQADVVVTGRRYGNSTGLLPFSVLVDAGGMVRWTHLGVLNREELLQEIRSLK